MITKGGLLAYSNGLFQFPCTSILFAICECNISMASNSKLFDYD